MRNGKVSCDSPKQIKTIIIGKISVGKSSLILKYAHRSNALPQTTVGIDILSKRVSHRGETYALELWDTAGHERYRTVVYNYFFHAQAAVVVFDLDDADSLEDARVWLQQISLYCGQSVPKMLLGNKSDLFGTEALAKVLDGYRENIEQLRKDFGCEFYPVSAITGDNLEVSFGALLERAARQSGEGELSQTIKLHQAIEMQQLTGKRRRRCC